MWKKLLLTTGLLACVTCPGFISEAYTVPMQQTDTNLKLTYPLVYLESQTAQNKINTTIATYVDKMRDLYYNQKMYMVNQSFETTYEDDDLLSLIITSGWYNGQSAHGYYTSQGLVFNKHTGELIPATNYVHVKDSEQLYKLVYEGMLYLYGQNGQRRISPTMMFAEKTIDVHNDNYILLGGGNIAMLYQPYDLASFADGVTRIVFTPDKIEYINRLNS